MDEQLSKSWIISIVVNNYNYGRYLDAAIDSALSQSYPNVEVVVVDDGSTDDSREIIAGYGERVVAILKENGGQASAFNAGFAASRGEVVIFLDADDMLFPNTADRVMGIWRAGLSKVQYRLEIIDADGQRQGVLHYAGAMPSGDLRRPILSAGIYPHSPTSGNAFARSTLEQLLPMPEPEWRIGADGYLLLQSPFLGDVISLDEVLGYYRVHPSNHFATGDLDLKKVRGYLALDLKKLELLRQYATGPNIGTVPDLLRRPSHIKVRIASLRMAPEDHPFPEDKVGYLAKKGLAASWNTPDMSLGKRIVLSTWFILASLLPRFIAEPLFILSLAPWKRPSILRRFSG